MPKEHHLSVQQIPFLKLQMKHFLFSIAASAFLLLLPLTACTKGVRQAPEGGPGTGGVERPHETWVFRSVLDKKRQQQDEPAVGKLM
jgi:hypothetical protein